MRTSVKLTRPSAPALPTGKAEALRLALALLLLCAAAANLAQPRSLSPAQRSEWLRREATIDAMTPAQRRALDLRIAQWNALPEQARRERREHALAWRALPTEERAQVMLAATVFATLPPEQQQALRRQFEALDGRDRHGWLLGPVLGADYRQLQSLVSYVPVAEQAPLLEVLRSMSVAERADLAILAQRTPPQGRAALRRALLSTAAGNRGAWLRMQLDR